MAPRSLVGPHFLYIIIMAIEGGNSTEATKWIGLFFPNTKRGQCIGLNLIYILASPEYLYTNIFSGEANRISLSSQ